MLFCFSLHKIEERALTLRRAKNQMLYYIMLPSVNCFLELSNTFRKKKGGGRRRRKRKGRGRERDKDFTSGSLQQQDSFCIDCM